MFTNFLAEAFDILHIYELPNQSSPANYKSSGAYRFIEQLKGIEEFIKSQAEPLQEEIQSLSQSSLFFDMYHPQILNKVEVSNEKSMKETVASFNNPIRIDLLQYLIKYYYQFFYKKSESPQISSKCDLLPSSKRTFHSRHASLASLISIKQDDAKTLNKCWQNSSVLNKTKIVNLNKMFGMSYPPVKMFDISREQKDIINTFITSTLPFNSRNPSQRTESEISKDDQAKKKNPFQDQTEEKIIPAISNQVPSKQKPEILKQVIQKLESDDFVFKPHHTRKKSESTSKLVKGINSRNGQINEIDEFFFDKAKKVSFSKNFI